MTTCRLAWISSLVALLVCVASPAFAGHDDREVAFDRIELEVTPSDRLQIDYEVTDADWKRLGHEGIHPELNLYTVREDGERPTYAYNFDLDEQRDTLTLSENFDVFEFHQIQLDVLGFEGDWRVERVAAHVHGISGARLAFERSRADFTVSAVSPSPVPRNSDDHHASDDSGRSDDSDMFDDDTDEYDDAPHEEREREGDHYGNTDGRDRARDSDGPHTDEDEEEHVHDDEAHHDGPDDSHTDEDEEEHVHDDEAHHNDGDDTSHDDDHRDDANREHHRDRARQRARVISTCRDVTDYDSEMTACTEHTTDFEFDWALEAIEACGEVAHHSSEFETCLTTSGEYADINPAPVARTCGELFNHDSDVQSCLETGITYTTAPPSKIRACGSVANFDDDRLMCIEKAADLGAGGAEIIRACGEDTLESCLERATD